MYLRCTKWVNAGYIVHFLAMYLRCTGSVHHPLPPVFGVSTSPLFEVTAMFEPLEAWKRWHKGDPDIGVSGAMAAHNWWPIPVINLVEYYFPT